MTTSIPSLNWPEEQYRQFGRKAQTHEHRFHAMPEFQRDALIELLEHYPARRLQCYTMGDDPSVPTDWRTVDIAEHTSGEDLWRAVENGRLWLNLTNIEDHYEPAAALINAAYGEIGRHADHLRNPRGTRSALLISSPGAQVYYHVDAEPNMLWHFHGRKHVWLYPALDFDFVSQENLEDIYASERDEILPYDQAFDDRADYYLLEPGQAASWPHNGPHRIVNIDMNVSLATSYTTDTVHRRRNVQLANRFLLREMGIRHRSVREDGVAAAVKRFSYRAINRVRPFERRDRTKQYVTEWQLDPEAPLGLRHLDEPRMASFSAQREAERQAARGQPAQGSEVAIAE